MATVPDGRTARATRTRDAIVDALLALLEEGRLRATGAEIAARAGVSERSIFQHYPSRDALFAAVGERQMARVGEIVSPIDPATPIGERLDAFVAQRSAVLELLTPTRRAALLIADEHPALAGNIEEVRARKRERALATFAPELEPLPASAGAAVAAAASWSAWDALRAQQGLPLAGAREAMRELLAGTLGISRE
ncbi:MAG: TetR/AcrR family transcriptional regulator [Solirubrobacteraceae bacterium]|nr:TetR/AcrR family transcriptional regulator [Solirubrobacteraceae bacterium]